MFIGNSYKNRPSYKRGAYKGLLTLGITSRVKRSGPVFGELFNSREKQKMRKTYKCLTCTALIYQGKYCLPCGDKKRLESMNTKYPSAILEKKDVVRG